MDIVNSGTLQKMVNILRDATFRTNLCNCDFESSLVFRIDRVISMELNSTMAECSIVATSGCMLTSFWGCDLIEKRCDHDKVTSFRTKFSDDQWKCVAKAHELMIAVGAKFQNGFLDLSPMSCALLPFYRTKPDCSTIEEIVVAEMFSGGFSGWSHAVRSLIGQGVHMHHRWAIDKDPDCIEAYSKSHYPDLVAISPRQFWSEFWKLNEDPGVGREHVLIHSSISDRWWLTAFPEMIDVFVASPPCPPWAITNSSPGFARSDGLTFIHMITFIAWIRPKIVIIENIATIVRHPHWKLILALFQWAGYNLRGHHNLNLLDHVPQRRDRMILIATDARLNFDEYHVFDRWPVSKPLSLKSYDAIMPDNQEWNEYTDINDSEMKMYNDVSLLPKDATISGHTKRSKRDLHQYRYRDENSYAACFMTSYGRPCDVKSELLDQGGFYGSLLLQGNMLRKFALPEIVILQGTNGTCWVSKNIRQAMKILGNCIAVPHALWGLISGVFFLPEFPKTTLPDVLFSRAMSNHLTASNIDWESDEGGFRFFLRHDVHHTIQSTQPMMHFVKVDIQCVSQEYEFFCGERVNLHSAIHCITGASIPQSIEMYLNDDRMCSVQLYEDFQVKTHNLVLHTNVPSRLMISEVGFRSDSVGNPVVIILSQEGIIAVARTREMKVSCVNDIIRHCQFMERLHDRCICQNHLGIPMSPDQRCPDFIVAMRDVDDRCRKSLDQIHVVQFMKTFQCFEGQAQRCDINAFIGFLDTHGIRQAIHAFGWHFSIRLHLQDPLSQSVILEPSPGCLPLPTDSMKSFIVIRAFAAQIEDLSRDWLVGIEEAYEFEYAKVHIKMGDDCLWQGELPKNRPLQIIVDAWRLAESIFHEGSPMKLVIDGRNFNPEFTLASLFPRHGRDVKIHLVYPLHGGGSSKDTTGATLSDVDPKQHEQKHILCPNMCDVTGNSTQEISCDKLVSRILETMLSSGSHSRRFDLSMLQGFKWLEYDHEMVMQSVYHDPGVVMEFFHHVGLDVALHQLGWECILESSDEEKRVSIKSRAFAEHPVQQCCQQSVVRSVIASALSTLALPLPEVLLDNPVFVKVKLWNAWIFAGLIDGNTNVGIFTDPWTQVMTFMQSEFPLRIVSCGRNVNPDCPIMDFVEKDPLQYPHVKFMLVGSLCGGGKAGKHDEIVQQKNALATFLLERGADLQTTSIFSEKIVKTAGQQAMQHILQIPQPGAKLAALKKLADTMVLKMPELSKIDTQRKALVQKKVRNQNFTNRTPHPSEFRLQEDFFLNQDDTPCRQIETIQAGSSGIALMSAQDAVPWLQADSHISQDELAALVLGPCPCTDPSRCYRMIIPAYDSCNKPALLSACLHNLGQHQLKIREVTKAADVAVSSTSVCAITAFRDELEPNVWTQLLEAPVKVCFELLQQAGCSLSLPCAPWGRSWKSSQGKCVPSVAESFQVHIRIPWAKKESLLKTSGIAGVYVTPKAEDRMLDDGYAIVWLDKSLGELRVLAASCPRHFGLVKLVKSKGKRVNRGIRFVKDEFAEMHAHLKPGTELPMQLTCVHFAKIAPTPIGAMHDEVQAWLIEVDWQAKPIKPIGSDAWMIGAPVRFEANWASWNNQLLLLTWFPPKGQSNPKVVVAGNAGKKPDSQWNDQPQIEDSGSIDPWANYIHSTGRSLDCEKKGNELTKAVSAVPRSITGPIEERFQKQDSQISDLKSTLQALTGRIDQQEQSQVVFKTDVKKEFESIRGEMTQQCQQMTSCFEETLNRSLRRQDQQLSDSFTELKSLILDRAVPSKKAKTTKPELGEDESI